MRVTSFKRPEPLIIEHNWDGKLLARFAENIVETSLEEDGQTLTQYSYDEYLYEEKWTAKLARKIQDQKNVYLERAKNS